MQLPAKATWMVNRTSVPGRPAKACAPRMGCEVRVLRHPSKGTVQLKSLASTRALPRARGSSWDRKRARVDASDMAIAQEPVAGPRARE